MSTARGHHFVPQCYLRGFTRPDGRLFALDIRRKETSWPTPEKICKQRDFNRVEATGIEPDALEKSIAKFESQLAPHLRRVCHSRSIEDRTDWLWVLNCMAVLAARNPTARKKLVSLRRKFSNGYWIYSCTQRKDSKRLSKTRAKLDTSRQISMCPTRTQRPFSRKSATP